MFRANRRNIYFTTDFFSECEFCILLPITFYIVTHKHNMVSLRYAHIFLMFLFYNSEIKKCMYQFQTFNTVLNVYFYVQRYIDLPIHLVLDYMSERLSYVMTQGLFPGFLVTDNVSQQHTTNCCSICHNNWSQWGQVPADKLDIHKMDSAR